ncbi:MAG: tripartite tricarboxylate transporter substrate binding protein [Acetobacteraceae bacterium]|nr:tripartite tricarboxylate transporter substrate binding protein [Acetobacteraceae bacterium]MDW8399883.1 tripartite tricarboxylate transporter substrate binding protein [Acetobacteraceae bacterium]
MTIARRAALALPLLALPAQGRAQPAWPSRPVRILVPFAPGGLTDTSARAISDRLGEVLGQNIIVENRPGGGSSIGALAVARSAPDGSVFLFNTLSHIVVPMIQDGIPYDEERDFVPVTQIATLPLMFAVPEASPIRDMAGLIEAARRAPGSVTVGHAGNATAGHFAAALLQSRARVQITDVAYRGGSEAARDLAAGVLNAGVLSIAAVRPLLSPPRIRLIAATGPRRSAIFPEVPTVAEVAVPGFAMEEWVGLFAPTGTPREIVARMQQAIAQVLGDAEVRRRLDAIGAEPLGSTPEAFAAFLAEARAAARTLVREANIRAG